jgi:hypothetical protein
MLRKKLSIRPMTYTVPAVVHGNIALVMTLADERLKLSLTGSTNCTVCVPGTYAVEGKT